MTPTILPGDRVCAEDEARSLPRRGEIWVFHFPATAMKTPGIGIKRVIGLPGETIRVAAGKVWIDGKPLAEAYIKGSMAYTMTPKTLGPGEYFLMGDNRNASNDSHLWGPLPANRLIAKVKYRVWPMKRIGGL